MPSDYLITTSTRADWPNGTHLVNGGSSTPGISSRVVCGALLYRVGKHRIRDMLRYCLPDNTGGYYESHACGHLWIEVDDDIVDFCSGHWVAEAQMLYETTTDPYDRKLGPVEWSVVPPAFIWQSAHSLKAPWRPRGQPTVGNMWYGPWSGCSPNYGVYDRLMEETAPLIRGLVSDAGLRERVGALLDNYTD